MTEEHNPYQPPSVDVDPPMGNDGQYPGGGGGGVYIPGGGRATATIVFLYINLAVDLGSAIATAFLVPMIGDAQRGDISTLSSLQTIQVVIGIFAFLQLAALLGCCIAFCMWFHRAYSNLLGLGVPMLQHKPGWAPGSFFVPILNLFRPYQIAKEIWLSSKNDGSLDSGPIGLWWACFLISGFVGNIGARLSNSADTVTVGLIASIISEVLSMGAAIMAVKVVKGIEQRQAETASQMGQQQMAQPQLGQPLP